MSIVHTAVCTMHSVLYLSLVKLNDFCSKPCIHALLNLSYKLRTS